mgnify:CR=1 FL=1
MVNEQNLQIRIHNRILKLCGGKYCKAYDRDHDLSNNWTKGLLRHIVTNTVLNKNNDDNNIYITIIKPINDLVSTIKKHKYCYPELTNEYVKNEYIDTIKKGKMIKGAVAGGLAIGAILGGIVLTVATGGLAAPVITAGLAGIGGSMVGGVAVVAAGAVALTAGGVITGGAIGHNINVKFDEYKEVDIIEQIHNENINYINQSHKDKYYHANGKIAYDGDFKNNIPHGSGTWYSDEGNTIWAGKIYNGQLCVDNLFGNNVSS